MAPPKQYPWDRWFRRRRITLRAGRDFTAQVHSMAVMIRRRAAERDIPVSVFIDGKTITIERKN